MTLSQCASVSVFCMLNVQVPKRHENEVKMKERILKQNYNEFISTKIQMKIKKRIGRKVNAFGKLTSRVAFRVGSCRTSERKTWSLILKAQSLKFQTQKMIFSTFTATLWRFVTVNCSDSLIFFMQFYVNVNTFLSITEKRVNLKLLCRKTTEPFPSGENRPQTTGVFFSFQGKIFLNGTTIGYKIARNFQQK